MNFEPFRVPSWPTGSLFNFNLQYIRRTNVNVRTIQVFWFWKKGFSNNQFSTCIFPLNIKWSFIWTNLATLPPRILAHNLFDFSIMFHQKILYDPPLFHSSLVISPLKSKDKNVKSWRQQRRQATDKFWSGKPI